MSDRRKGVSRPFDPFLYETHHHFGPKYSEHMFESYLIEATSTQDTIENIMMAKLTDLSPELLKVVIEATLVPDLTCTVKQRRPLIDVCRYTREVVGTLSYEQIYRRLVHGGTLAALRECNGRPKEGVTANKMW